MEKIEVLMTNDIKNDASMILRSWSFREKIGRFYKWGKDDLDQYQVRDEKPIRCYSYMFFIIDGSFKKWCIHACKTFCISIFILIFFFQRPSVSNAIDVYEPGLKLSLSAKWWGVYAYGTIEVIKHDKVKGQDVVLVRSQTEEVSGLLGFLLKFIRVYKGSNTFDSYIDPKTGLSVRYEVYKLEKDGTKKLNEHVYFDRKTKRVASYDDNSTILSNVQPDIQDTFSGFLNLIRMLNTEDIYVGKNYSLNLYIYKEYSRLNVRVINQKLVDGYNVYTLKIDRLPDVFKYPASLAFDVVEKGELRLPSKGICTIDIPIKNINVDGNLTIINGD